MTDKTRDIFYQFIGARRTIVTKRLKETAKHQALCDKLAESQKKIEELFGRFSDEERKIIYEHYDDEYAKVSDFADETYIQGLRDSFKIYTLFGVFGNEDSL